MKHLGWSHALLRHDCAQHIALFVGTEVALKAKPQPGGIFVHILVNQLVKPWTTNSGIEPTRHIYWKYFWTSLLVLGNLMPPQDMHGKRFSCWTDSGTIGALNTTATDMFCFNMVFDVVSPKRCKSTGKALPLTSFQLLHAGLDHLIQVCRD